MNQPANEPVECPKCGTSVPAAASACPRCGLARDRFASFAADAGASVPPGLAAQWTAVLERWDDETAHERFLEAGLAAQAFPYMARCYRTAAREKGDDPIAEQRLQDIARRAEAAILTAAQAAKYKEDEHDEPFKRVSVMMAVLIVIIAAGMAYALLSGGGAPGEY